MRNVISIDPSWLTEVAPHFYQQRRHNPIIDCLPWELLDECRISNLIVPRNWKGFVIVYFNIWLFISYSLWLCFVHLFCFSYLLFCWIPYSDLSMKEGNAPFLQPSINSRPYVHAWLLTIITGYLTFHVSTLSLIKKVSPVYSLGSFKKWKYLHRGKGQQVF